MRSHAPGFDPFARGFLDMAGREFSPATGLRAGAQAKYSKRFRAAYGPIAHQQENCALLPDRCSRPHVSTGARTPNCRLPLRPSQGRDVGIWSIQSNVRTSAPYPRGHRMPPARRLLNFGRRELAPTTAVRAHAQAKYSERFRADFSRNRSRGGTPCRWSTAKSSAPRTDPHRDAKFPLTVTTREGTDSSARSAHPHCEGMRPYCQRLHAYARPFSTQCRSPNSPTRGCTPVVAIQIPLRLRPLTTRTPSPGRTPPIQSFSIFPPHHPASAIPCHGFVERARNMFRKVRPIKGKDFPERM